MSKKLILLALVAGAAWLFWVWVGPWVESPTRFSDVGIWLKPLGALGLLGAIIGLSFMLIKNRWFRLAVSVAAGLPFLLVFDFNKFYLIAFALILSLHIEAGRSINRQSAERIKIDIGEIMRHSLPSIITPILLLVSFAFFFSPAIQQSSLKKELPPTAKQVISRVISSFLGGELDQLPPQERQETEKLLVERVFDQFNQILAPYFKFFPPLLAFGLFLILQGLSFVFVWLGMAIAIPIFWVLKRSGLVRISVVQKESEELRF